MFSIYHLIWLAICACLIPGMLCFIKKKNVSFGSVLTAAFTLSCISEFVKVISVIKMVPLSDGTNTVPYIELNHLPLHMCSIQILLIAYVKFASEKSGSRRAVLAFMFPTCILGALMALLMPSIYSTTIRPDQSFTHPMGYQFFLFHTMLIILGLCIYRDSGINLTAKDYRTTLMMVVLVSVAAIYLNSVFAVPLYENGDIVSIENYTNFFFTYVPPIPVQLTEVWHWVLYLFILFLLCAGLLALVYIPVFRKSKKA